MSLSDVQDKFINEVLMKIAGFEYQLVKINTKSSQELDVFAQILLDTLLSKPSVEIMLVAMGRRQSEQLLASVLSRFFAMRQDLPKKMIKRSTGNAWFKFPNGIRKIVCVSGARSDDLRGISPDVIYVVKF